MPQTRLSHPRRADYHHLNCGRGRRVHRCRRQETDDRAATKSGCMRGQWGHPGLNWGPPEEDVSICYFSLLLSQLSYAPANIDGVWRI